MPVFTDGALCPSRLSTHRLNVADVERSLSDVRDPDCNPIEVLAQAAHRWMIVPRHARAHLAELRAAMPV